MVWIGNNSPTLESVLSTSQRVRARFLTCSSPVDWGVGRGDLDDDLEATGIAMAKTGFKEESEAGEKDCWVDVMDWEAFRAQEVLPLPEQLTVGWETICHHDPDAGC